VAKAPIDIRSLARVHAPSAIRTLAAICAQSESDSARVMAANALLDRGFGKAPVAITGENGEGGIEVIIRHIIDDRRAPPLTIEVNKVED
jgi:hypothetical protein